MCIRDSDFAALFLTLGIIKGSIGAIEAKAKLDRIRNLIGKWVSFQDVEGCTVGRLEYDEALGEIKILHYNRKMPNFESMTEEEIRKYNPPKSGALWSILKSKQWHTIRPVGREYDLARGARANQSLRAGRQNKVIETFERLLETEFGDYILSSTGCLARIYGNITRINIELDESLDPNMQLRLAEILRPDSRQEFAASTHCSVSKNSGAVLSELNGCAILEAGRCIEDCMAATIGTHRIVLLGRNSINYEECAQLIKNAYYHRCGDEALVPHVKTPLSIKYLSFYHA